MVEFWVNINKLVSLYVAVSFAIISITTDYSLFGVNMGPMNFVPLLFSPFIFIAVYMILSCILVLPLMYLRRVFK